MNQGYEMKSPCTRRGFTLMEIMLAVTIFAMVATAIYSTFRVGVRAWEAGRKEITRMQQARIVFDTMSRDLRSVYYRAETSYNSSLRSELNRFQQQWMQAQNEGTMDDFLYGDPDDPDDEGAINPYSRYIEIDLGFQANDNELKDTLSFVRYQYDDGVTMIQPWGLGRITYTADDGKLIRTEEDVIEPMKDIEGEVLEEKIPREEVLAKGVVQFDLQYGFFFDEDWMEAMDWDSSEKRYRNPAEDLEEEFGNEYDDDFNPQDPEYREALMRERMKPEDGIPAYVRITLELEELSEDFRTRANEDENKRKSDSSKKEEKRGRTEVFSTIVKIPSAQENYLPTLFEDEEGNQY